MREEVRGMKRRITEMLIVLVMLLGMMPGTARAEILTAAAGITEVGIPSGRILTYNSSMQTGVEEGSFYSIIGNTARNVGTCGR